MSVSLGAASNLWVVPLKTLQNIFPGLSVTRISGNMKISWWSKGRAGGISSTWRRSWRRIVSKDCPSLGAVSSLTHPTPPPRGSLISQDGLSPTSLSWLLLLLHFRTHPLPHRGKDQASWSQPKSRGPVSLALQPLFVIASHP